MVGPPDLAIDAYKRWKYVVATRIQGSLRDEKGKVFSTQHTHQELLDLGLPVSMSYSDQGMKILGAAIGSFDFMISFLDTKVTEIEHDMAVVGRMKEHHPQWAVTVKSIQQRMQYVFRCMPCGDRTHFSDLASRYDDAILSVLQ